MLNKLPGQFTTNCHLVDFVKSATAKSYNILEQYHPEDNVVDNLEYLAVTVVQPLMDILIEGMIVISSGYRCKRLNDIVGGSEKSQHMTGQAVDLQFICKGQSNDKIVKTMLDHAIPFDQMIKEKSKTAEWIHISCKKTGNRFQQLNINV